MLPGAVGGSHPARPSQPVASPAGPAGRRAPPPPLLAGGAGRPPAGRSPRRAGASNLLGQAASLPLRSAGGTKRGPGVREGTGRARSLIYLEDQYLWSDEVAGILAAALERSPTLRLIAVVPR